MNKNSEYNFSVIEKKWQDYWKENQINKVEADPDKKKCYVLDMFPYPSGAGLHVGHPLGYIATDIYSRYKKLKGFNVLHPMGFDAFGLPAEQYAIQTGQHPAITTDENIKRYKEQLEKMGFCYDWSREVRTSDPSYYKWTQWIFLKIFNSWYNTKIDKACPIEELLDIFEKEGFSNHNKSNIFCSEELDFDFFTADEWKGFDEEQKQIILLNFRLAFLSEAYVNWCPAMGTVLSNDEVKDGLSERGGFQVERKLMKQWSLRITAYAERLRNDLDTIDWSESLSDAQRNWIGKSEGCSMRFSLKNTGQAQKFIEVFTTRPDTIFGVSFLSIAPENELALSISTAEKKQEILNYINISKKKSERERQADVKNITGAFTGAYALHPFTGAEIPVWVGDYVLAGYGTGAVMGVPAHDSRDHAFAKHFGLKIPPVIKPLNEEILGGKSIEEYINDASYDTKEGIVFNSDFIDGMSVYQAISTIIKVVEEREIGKGKTNYRLRDAIFGRQRYWGEPIPIFYKNNIPYGLPESELPLVLPEVDKFLPTEEGESPLARAKNWKYTPKETNKSENSYGYKYEDTTMPGWAGSSWYFLRYMDPANEKEFVSKKAVDYWQNVDLYLGGSEHATGHLLYVRFWTKFLFDLGLIPFFEPAKKLINQGMIQGRSNFVYRIKDTNKFVSFGLKDAYETTAIHVDVNIVENDVLDLEAFKLWRDDFSNAEFILENGKYICGTEVEKMSKSKWNVVSPDDIIADYGADTLRLYEMFLGPLEQSKPWNTNGIEGVHRFMKKLWRLFFNRDSQFIVLDKEPSKDELRSIHKLIKKIGEDVESFSFNTSVSAFMVCVNELGEQECHKRSILQDLLICLAPYAPHISEELWSLLGNQGSIFTASFPQFEQNYLVLDSFSYPVSVNGKHRTNIEILLDTDQIKVEQIVLSDAIIQKWLDGKAPTKIIFVKGRIINLVL